MIKAFWLFCCLLLAGCSGVDVNRYSAEKPTLELRQFFTGKVEAWGMFQKRSGEVLKRFHVDIDGHAEGDNFIMHEAFTYSDGSKQTRVWTLHLVEPNHWRGTASDVVGVADGQVAGNALRWQYVLSLPVDGKVYQVNFDDWMFLLDENTLANRSYVTKFGFEVGQVTLFFRKKT